MADYPKRKYKRNTMKRSKAVPKRQNRPSKRTMEAKRQYGNSVLTPAMSAAGSSTSGSPHTRDD